MSLAIQQSEYFWADLRRQVDWYRDYAAPEMAERFVDAVAGTLNELAQAPGLGRPRFKDWPELAGIRSWRVRKPYHRHLIFYRSDAKVLLAERVVHEARDPPRRLLQPPYEAGE